MINTIGINSTEIIIDFILESLQESIFIFFFFDKCIKRMIFQYSVDYHSIFGDEGQN